MIRTLACCLAAASITAATAEPWSVAQDGTSPLALTSGGNTVLAWHRTPLANPKGGAKFAGSAFFHPLRTPSGFDCADLQPADHLHHFGLWWPWKFIEVDGKVYNTWEIQEGQGGHTARSAKVVESKPGRTVWQLENEFVITDPATKQPRPVIAESTTAVITRSANRHILDLTIRQKPLASKGVKITAYRYSGFSWRGPATWNTTNSTMLTSAGNHRDNANGTRAHWVLVHGQRPGGEASVLILSAASRIAGTEEQVRVWDSKATQGAQFANFNPVMETALPLDEKHPAVSHRRYRVILADQTLTATEAEQAWQEWR